MYTGKIAIPTNTPGGIDGQRSDHFGHCEIFTLVAVRDGNIQEVSTLANVPHQAGGCMAPVGALSDQGGERPGGLRHGGRPFQALRASGHRRLFCRPNAVPRRALDPDRIPGPPAPRHAAGTTLQGHCRELPRPRALTTMAGRAPRKSCPPMVPCQTTRRRRDAR